MAAPIKDTMNRKEAAMYLTGRGYPITAATLAKYAANNNAGKGPSFTRFRWKMVRYKREDLDVWAEREGTRVE